MIKQFISQLTALTGSDPGQQKFLVAVSGGVDSMVLAHLFYQAGLTFSIAHVNFQLRGDESDADAAFVKQTAEQWKVPYFEKTVDTRLYQAEQKVSLQMAARELRYTWFTHLLKQEKVNWIVTAHQANDRFETAIINLMHGGSPLSVAGIRPKQTNVIRPLLHVSRHEIEQYAIQNQVAWREDSSNRKNDYDRNEVRNNVLPHLYAWQPHWQQAFERTVRKTEDEVALREWAVNEFKKKYVHQSNTGLRIEIAGLQALGNFTSILYEFIKEYGFSYDQSIAIAKSNTAQVGNLFENDRARIVVDRNHLVVQFTQATPWHYPVIQQADGVYTAGQHVLEIKKVKIEEVVFSADRAYFDAEQVAFPLQWRRWQAGDTLQPFGMAGTKNVSDILIDIKMPLAEKEKQTVLLAQNKIIWVVGIRQSEQSKLTKNSKLALEVKFKVIND